MDAPITENVEIHVYIMMACNKKDSGIFYAEG